MPWWPSSRDRKGNADCQQAGMDEQHCNNQLAESGKSESEEVSECIRNNKSWVDLHVS